MIAHREKREQEKGNFWRASRPITGGFTISIKGMGLILPGRSRQNVKVQEGQRANVGELDLPEADRLCDLHAQNEWARVGEGKGRAHKKAKR